MHRTDPERWRHGHDFLPPEHRRGERRTRQVIALTAVMMVVEIVAGVVFGSMALLADGWHMASHASALGITAFAYAYARRHAGDPRYSFGTWKVGVLGGYTSAVVLGVIAALIAWESLGRLWRPATIRFEQAMGVAAVGLVVNLVSAYLLRGEPHEHAHGGEHEHDHNLRAAYFHVLADALTSVLAIVALGAGKYLGWVAMDPLMGLVGAAVIARWSFGLMRDGSRVLLDGDVAEDLAARVRETLEAEGGDRVADLHLWRVGPRDLAAIVSVVTDAPRPPAHYKAALEAVSPSLSHVTVEVIPCDDESPPAVASAHA